MKWFAFAALALLILACGGAGGTGSDGNAAQLPEAKRRLAILAQGLFIYMADTDDYLPQGEGWHGRVSLYIPEPNAFRSPAFDGTSSFGFALNSALPSESSSWGTEDAPLVFDSTNLEPSAYVGIETLPDPGRYGGKNAIVFTDGTPNDLEPTLTVAQDRLRKIAVGLLLYSADNDDRLPLANWHDNMLPYLKNPKWYRSPIFEGTASFGFAMYRPLVGTLASEWPSYQDIPSFFDSTELGASAVSGIDTLPNPGRYEGANAIAYLDGSVRKVGRRLRF